MFRRRYGRRRYGRTKFSRGRRPYSRTKRSKRFIKKTVRSMAELKWGQSTNLQNITPDTLVGVFSVFQLYPATIAVGADKNQRIGRRIRTKRLTIRYSCEWDNLQDSAVNSFLLPFRIILMTVREGGGQPLISTVFDSNQGTITPPLYSIAALNNSKYKVHFDKNTFISNSYNHTGYRVATFFKKVMPWNFNLNFDTSGQMITSSAIPYLVILCGDTNNLDLFRMNIGFRLTYVDI